MTGLGLEPRTNGSTYLIGFHRPPEAFASEGMTPSSRVERLDNAIAISGVRASSL